MRFFNLLALSGLSATQMTHAAPNPIRRVVTLLQEMSKEISAELENEKKMFEKFQCYCKKNKGGLAKKNEEAAAQISKTKAEVEGQEGLKQSLTEDLKKHKKDREAAKNTLEAATKKRNADKAAFDAATKEQRDTISAIDGAVVALEKGMGKSSFMQVENKAAQQLSRVAPALQALADKDGLLDLMQQQTLSNFLQGDYHSASGEIVGILKQMRDNLDEDLGGVLSAEDAAIKAFKAQKAAQETIIAANSEAIESKTDEKGKVAVKIVEGKNQISMLNKQLGDDQATLAELLEVCKTKDTEYADRQKDGAMEVEAIGQAIGVLNNDDALDLFKKTDTKAAFMFLQTPVSSVISNLNKLQKASPAVAMLAYTAKQALKAKKVDFSKILQMIDDMNALLAREAEDDVKTKESCNFDLNEAAMEKKDIDHAIKGLSASIEDHESSIAEQISTIKNQLETIDEAKKAQAEATEQRSKENAEYVEAVQLNREAVELILKAKDKLMAFYNPEMVRKQMAVETTEEAQSRALGGSLIQKLPGDTPEIFSGERETGAKKSQGVMGLMDTIANDLNSDTQAREHAETTGQAEYEKLSMDLSGQIMDANKMKAQAEGIKAEKEEAKQTASSTLSMKQDESANNAQTTTDLHAKCDFILETFDERKVARDSEMAGLTKAKAILKGANFE